MLIAIGSEVPNTITIPLSMGALRANSAASELSWMEEATIAHSQGRRPVLVGDISQPERLLASLLSAKNERPQIRFALLLHYSQALQTPLPDSLRSQFDEVYVAVDQMISVADAHAIRQAVRPRWLLVPRVGLDWNQIIIGRLIPERRGTVTILCPPAESSWANEGPFLSTDEILIHVQAFQHEHPLIEVRPPPHEWFVPSHTSPWEMPSRDLRRATILKKTEEPIVPNVSFVVPFHWKNQSSAEAHLATCLRTCLRVVDYVYAMSESITVEYIVSIDRDFEATPFDIESFRKNSDPRIFRSLTIVESARTSGESDWRAGFIRNAGARFSRVGSAGLLVFIDSDVEIVDPAIVASEIIEGRNSLVFSRVRSETPPTGKKPVSQENQPFQVASSRLMIVRRSLFEHLGGFANAFRTYGCEDNFLVWQTSEILKKGLPVSMAAFPFATTRDLSPTIDKDDLVAKMARLTVAADLFYRMTFDPRVHRHFFVSLGTGLGFRYFLKRLACGNLLRPILGPLVFLMTLIETKNRAAYLRGLWDVIRWKVKRPLLLVSSEAWRLGQAKHVAKKHSWKIPNVLLKAYYLVRHLGAMTIVIGQRAWIKLRANKFGWNIFGWRLFVGLQKLWGESRRFLSVKIFFPSLHIVGQIPWWTKVAGVRFFGFSKLALAFGFSRFQEVFGFFRMAFGEIRRLMLVYFIYPSLHVLKQIPWWTKVGGERLWGLVKLIWGGIKFSAGWGHKLFVDHLWIPGLRVAQSPYHLTRLYGWKLIALMTAPFRYIHDNFWKLKVMAKKLRGELWRIPVLWNRLLGQLWFIPIGFKRLGEKMRGAIRFLKEKTRGTP